MPGSTSGLEVVYPFGLLDPYARLSLIKSIAFLVSDKKISKSKSEGRKSVISLVVFRRLCFQFVKSCCIV